VTLEILVFANFDFKINTLNTKVIVGDRVQDETRYVLNWSEYLAELKQNGLMDDERDRAYFSRYRTPRAGQEVFVNFQNFQTEIREILDMISQEKVIPFETWQTIFREALKVQAIIQPVPQVQGMIHEADLDRLRFEKKASAETYRAYLYAELRDLIVSKKVFRLRKCPECRNYFYDQTKNGKKIYCSAQSCGHRAKQKAANHRKSADRKAPADNQGALDFFS